MRSFCAGAAETLVVLSLLLAPVGSVRAQQDVVPAPEAEQPAPEPAPEAEPAPGLAPEPGVALEPELAPEPEPEAAPAQVPTPPARPLGSPFVSPFAASIESPPTAPEEAPAARRLLPTHVAQRPLSLPAGIGIVYVGYAMRLSPFVMTMPIALALGVTDDVTVEARYSILYEPEIRGIGRVYHDNVVELGFRGLLRIPAARQGDTVAALEAVVLLHPLEVFRIETGLGIDLLFTDPVSPLVYISLEIDVSLNRHFWVGVRGWAGNDDGFWSGSAGGHLGFTVASPLRPILDVRIGVQVAVPSDGISWMIVHTFYPTIFD